MSWVDSLLNVPYSTCFIFFFNSLLIIVSSIIVRMTVNLSAFKEKEEEMNNYDKALEDANKRGDKARIRKLKRQEARMKALSKSVSRGRMGITLVMVLPFTLTSFLLGEFYRGQGVVIFPFDIGFLRSASFYIWHLLTFLAAYLPLTKVLGTSIITTQDSGGV